MTVDRARLNKIADRVFAHGRPNFAKLIPNMLPTQLLLIEHKVDDDVIHQRPRDGYVNATQMCQKAGKLLGHYHNNASTKAYLKELQSDIGIPISELIQIVKGGSSSELQGTWVHPYVATHLAQWLSPRFAVWVNKWVYEWAKGNISGYMPPHVARYIKNRQKIPHTFFSMLNEIYLNLVAPLEDAGFQMPDKMLPDISTGKIFSTFLKRKGIDPSVFPTYEHEFSDHRPLVYARLYPIEHLPDFRIFFNEEWLTYRAEKYFQKRVPEALPYISSIKLLTST